MVAKLQFAKNSYLLTEFHFHIQFKIKNRI